MEKCEQAPAWAREINVTGLERLIEVLPPTTRLVYCSSDHVFGGRDAGYDENDSPDPVSVYGRTREEAERLVLGAG